MQVKSKRFRVAWVTEPGFAFNALAPHVQRIEFLTSGAEADFEARKAAISVKLLDFRASEDVVIPTGKVASNLAVGLALSGYRSIWIGLFRDGEYSFQEIGGDGESL
jgi:hypothetical protein